MNDSPKLFAVYFPGDGPNSAFYERMAKVLDYTAHRHCSNWQIDVRLIDPGKYSNQHQHSHISNTHKLDHWNRFVLGCADGDRVLLMDSDMMILRGLDEIWSQDFDIAYTSKNAKLPFNGGVLFLRVSAKTKLFMQAYWDKNMELLNDRNLHAKHRAKCGGMNQAAFGALIPEVVTPKSSAIETPWGKLVAIPCRDWNCAQGDWAKYTPESTRIVHVKSGLRKAIFGRGPIEPHLTPLIDIWRSLERESQPALSHR